jgi:hypothetical protein
LHLIVSQRIALLPIIGVTGGMRDTLTQASALSEACGPVAQDDPTFEHNVAMTLLLMREMCRSSLGPDSVSQWKVRCTN